MTKYEKSADYIYNVIKEEYANLQSLVNSKDITNDLELLVDNKIAYKIDGIIPSTGGCSKYKIICKFLKEFDKDLNKYNMYRSQSGYNYKFNNTAGRSQYLNDLFNEPGFESGTYYVNMSSKSKEDYAVFIVTNSIENSGATGKFSLYLVGDRAHKFRDKLFKLFEERDRIFDEEDMSEAIIANGQYKETKFKSFDELVMRNKEEYIKYIDNWKDHIVDYYNLGMIPKLSVLIYGEPGTGKSTFCRALAKHLKLKYITPIMPNYFDNDNKNRSNAVNSEESVIVIDDIDCICKSRDLDDSKENNDRTARLLAYLDEPDTFLYKANDGKYYPIAIIAATTNYYDKLDKAVKRYGRFDLQIEMNNFDKEEAEEMCALYGLKLKDVYDKKYDKEVGISPSYLQALCMRHVDKSLKKVD